MKKRISDSFSMGMNSYGKEFQRKGLFLDLGILDLLKWRRTGIQFVTLLSEASLSEYPSCWNSPASSAICTLPPWGGAGWHGGGTAPGTTWARFSTSALPLPSQVTYTPYGLLLPLIWDRGEGNVLPR